MLPGVLLPVPAPPHSTLLCRMRPSPVLPRRPHHHPCPRRASPSSAAGNSPVQIHRAQLAGIVNDWYRLSIAIKNDTEADREFGWVQEM